MIKKIFLLYIGVNMYPAEIVAPSFFKQIKNYGINCILSLPRGFFALKQFSPSLLIQSSQMKMYGVVCGFYLVDYAIVSYKERKKQCLVLFNHKNNNTGFEDWAAVINEVNKIKKNKNPSKDNKELRNDYMFISNRIDTAFRPLSIRLLTLETNIHSKSYKQYFGLMLLQNILKFGFCYAPIIAIMLNVCGKKDFLIWKEISGAIIASTLIKHLNYIVLTKNIKNIKEGEIKLNAKEENNNGLNEDDKKELSKRYSWRNLNLENIQFIFFSLILLMKLGSKSKE